jgi:hypothetical protein
LGVTAAVWGAYTFPVSWAQAGIIKTALHIVVGDTFKPGALEAINGFLDTIPHSQWQHPLVLSSIAILRLRSLEQATSDGDRASIDRQMRVLEESIESSLRTSPDDPYLWMVLFWLTNTKDGFSRKHLKYLAMSYRTGPNEGWVAIKRNRLALALFGQLTIDLQQQAIAEFARLVDSNFLQVAADNLTGPGWPVRDRLVGALSSTDVVKREQFAKLVYRMGYDIKVPGVERPEFRPWQ